MKCRLFYCNVAQELKITGMKSYELTQVGNRIKFLNYPRQGSLLNIFF
jgi:hypothetical protein